MEKSGIGERNWRMWAVRFFIAVGAVLLGLSMVYGLVFGQPHHANPVSRYFITAAVCCFGAAIAAVELIPVHKEKKG